MSSVIERWTSWVWLSFAAACAEDAALDSSGSEDCFVGDASQPVEFEIVHQTAQRECVTTEDMAEIPLIQPPQGGKVLFVSVRARNLNGCGLTLATALAEPESGSIISLERRPVTLKLREDGWMDPDRPSEASNYSNLPACPRADLDRSIEGELYELRVNITDKDGRKASASTRVVPICGEPNLAELCQCECSKDYQLGAQCSAPAGMNE